jgi:hypothetical protein
MEDKLNIFDRSFWNAWIMKLLRNVASVKYQFMVAFFFLVVYGMFLHKTPDGMPFISATQGLAFLSGGFITLVTSRLAIRTSLFESKDDADSPTTKDGSLDTDR